MAKTTGFFRAPVVDPTRSAQHRPRGLRLEPLETRTLLTATTVMESDHVALPAASAATSGFTPAQIRAAYGFSNASFGSVAADGTGQTIAIIDAYNDPNIASDLATFDAAFGIAAPPSLKIVNQNGGSTLPSTDPSQGWEGEIALDVEWAHAIAPGANILLVEANSASDSDLFAAVNYARQQAGVSVVSMSWGSQDTASNASFDQRLSQQYLVTPSGHQGVTFVASTGDNGYASFPSTSPNVLAVGGTDLYLNSNNTISSETAWTPSVSGGTVWSGGGGTSTEFSGRKVPDVSYDAGIGFRVYDTFGPDHGWVVVGGTSAGAPQWSALVAIANQGRALNGLSTLDGASQTLAAIYAAPASYFHDITSGSTQYQTATTGYDLATGRGTPVANQLISYLATYGSSTGTGTGTGTTTAPTAPVLSGSALSSSQVSLSWTAASGASGYRVYETVSGVTSLYATLDASTTSTTVSALPAATTSTFQIVAYNTAGSASSNTLSLSTLAATTAVTAPQNFAIAATSSTTALLSWSAVSGATGYQIYQWNGSRAVLVASLGAGTTSYSAAGLSTGATSYFYVQASNSSSTAATSWVGVTTPAAAVVVTAPQNFSITATSSTTAQLNWSATSGATGYRVYEWNGSQAVLVATLGSSSTSYSASGLSAGATSYFYVQAYNSASSATTGWVSVTTPLAATTVSAPTGLTAVAVSSTTGRLTWNVSAGATSYQVYYWNGSQAQLLGSVTTTSATISGMTAGTTNYFYIKAVSSTSSAATGWVSLTTPLQAALSAIDVAFSQYTSSTRRR